MTKQYTRVLALLLVLLTFTTVVLTGCKNTEEPPVTTEPEVTTTEAYTEETEPPVQEIEVPRTPGVYFVTVLPTANGSVTASCTEAKEGDAVTLTVTPDEGYELISLVANGHHSEETFSMPAEDVFVVARFGYPKDVDWKEYPSGDFFGSTGKFHCSDVLDMSTDSGNDPYLVMDADKATPLYAYVKGMSANQFYLELTAKVTGIRADENYPKFGFMTNDGAEMVKFYLDMTTDKQVGTVGAVHQLNGGADDWAGQRVWNLNKKLDLTNNAVKLGLLRDGNRYYFYVNGTLVAAGNDLSTKNTATGIFSFGTSLKLTDYKLVQSGNDLNTLLTQAKADAEAFYAVALTENFFSKTAEGVYTLTTDSDAQHMVDDVTVAGKVMREKYYRVSGKLSLTDAEEWGQARILISADPQNEYFIALEKLGDGNYQIFTMSKANEEGWNNWELIASAVVNGNRNSIDFEVVVNGDQLYFLIDNEVYYTGSRVSMTESTVKFTGFNVGTTTVENLSAEVFADAAAAEKYVSGKTVKDFGGTTLTGNYFTEIAEGVYTLTTDSDAQHKVDDVIHNGQTLRQSNYRVSGKLSLTDAAEWGQARILVSADPQNEYFIALEKLGDGNYQIFTMSKANEEDWNNWELIASGAENGNRNSIDFEVVVIGDQLYFLIDNEVYYTGSRVSMTESTVKFTGYNVGTTTVENLSAEIFENQDAAQAYIATKEYKEETELETQPVVKPEGTFFGTAGEHTSSDVLDMSTDSGTAPYLVMDAELATPLYTYIKDLSEKQFYAEVTVQVTGIRADEGYPKFGFMTNDGDEMVKFYLDMNTEKQIGTVGAVHQITGGEDDWAGQKTWQLLNALDLTEDTVKLSLLRDGKNYYFYVNGELEAAGSDLSDKAAAVGVFSFGTSLKLTDYSVTKSGNELDALISKAQEDVEALSAVNLTTNYFTETATGVYTLSTDSDAQHKVDDVRIGRNVMRAAYYSVKGNLTLTDADEWGQARVLVSADPQNEYFIALEKLGDGNYQIFTMSKANEEGWNNWELIASGAENGNRSSINFEVVVIGDHLYFLIDNEIYYESSRVSMTESTVKFTGFNVGTTTVENLSAEIFENQDTAQDYIAIKAYKPEPTEPETTEPETQPEGEFFGTAVDHTSSNVLDMSTDSGNTPYLMMDAELATPLYAYIKNLSEKQFYAEVTVQVTGIRADEGYPKFGFMTNDGDEMVKFYLDMNTEKQVGTVGAVHQVSGGADDWAGQKTWQLLNALDLTEDTVKLNLLRDGKNYYFYVNGELEAAGSDLSDKAAAVGVFSFGTSLKLTDYSVTKSGDELDALISKAQEDVEALSAVNLTTNYFTETATGVYTLTTDSDAQHKVDDVRIGRNVMRVAYYSVQGKLSLTNAAEWGQARILVSADPQNEYFIALEKLGDDNYQIFTMSKANEEGWNNWELIASGAENGTRNSIDFEVVVIGDQLYFLINNEIYYENSRVSMAESTVKFTGFNVGTTTVETLSAEIFENQDAAQDYIATKAYKPEPEPTEPETTEPEITEPETQPEGEFFGTAGDHTSSNVLDMSTDSGDTPYLVMDAELATPLYAYIKDLSEKQFYAEVTVQVTGIRADEGYPKFGFITNDGDEMVKFYLDMNTEKQVGTVGAVHQVSGGEDDWAGQKTWQLLNALDLTEDTVKLSLLRDGKNYYFYVNGELEAVGSDLSDKAAAVGVFSFGTSLKLTDYSVTKSGDELDALISKAQEDVEALSAVNLTTNYFTETATGIYTLTTDSDAQHKVDDVRIGRTVMRAAYYSIKGRLSLTDANDWGQARILVSADAKNEYFIALEKTGANSYQIFTMSKANEENWNEWKLIESASHNGNRSVLDFELIVNGDQMYFLIEDEICYISSRVSMTESTVKFTGFNVGTTTVENLAVQMFADSSEAEAYAAGKNSRIGENFGVSEGTYFTTEGVSLANDKGDHATVSFVGGTPQYAYLHDLHTDKFCFETQVNVTEVLNNDGYPKFGIMVNGSSEMVKFFVDMTSAMTANHVGVVYQPTGGGDDWANSQSVNVPGMVFTGSDTIKLKLVREGRAYYFYVNDNLVIYDEDGFKAEKGAVGIFSFNTKLTASNYSVLTGSDANSAVQSAKDTVEEQVSKITLSTNWFADNGNGVYSLTTNSNAEHKVDDLNRGGNVLRTAYYSVKGKLTLTDAGNWGQARILISSDANNEYFIALERTDQGKFQIFTMSKRNRNYWYDWIEILHADVNGTRNSIDFELIVIENRLYFLIDDAVVYSDTSVALTESTVKFTGYNVGTTTVENLSAEVFEDQQDAENYLAEKNA